MNQTLTDLMNQSFDKHAERTALRTLQSAGGQSTKGMRFLSTTYRELRDHRDRLASGLAQLGITKGQRVGILTDGGVEPLVIFLAADLLGISSVPLCNKLPDDILVHNINSSGIVFLFIDPKSHKQAVRIRPSLENPPHLILTEGKIDGCRSFSEIMEAGAQEEPPKVALAPDDESKVIYTSGSSGLPKGVVQTHANIVANVKELWDIITERDPFIFFKAAPDYHSMGILNIYYPLAKGWTLDLPRSPDRALVDIRHFEPQGFLTVPLILDKVYQNVRKQIDAGGLRGSLVSRAVRAKRSISQDKASIVDRLANATLGKRIVQKIRSKLSDRVGSRLELLIVGAAKADPEALDFFQEVLDITTYEAYGTTECCPLIAMNSLLGQKTGTVGRPLMEVKLVDSEGHKIAHGDPETGVYEGSGEEAGELWVHGPNVMAEYLNDPEQTAKVLVRDSEGKIWYRTSDLFSMDNEGYLTFRGRAGRQFKLKNGEFVNPERLEGIYARIPLIEHVLVCGDHTRTFPLPLVTIDLDEANMQSDIPDLPRGDEGALCSHPTIVERIHEQMKREADSAGLPGHERPQKILVLTEPFTEEAGTLTRGLKKLVPKAILSRYEELIDQTYSG